MSVNAIEVFRFSLGNDSIAVTSLTKEFLSNPLGQLKHNVLLCHELLQHSSPLSLFSLLFLIHVLQSNL